MPFIPPFGSPPGGAAGASIELDNLGTTAINTSLISDTDSTDDLGSSSKAWDQLYVDDIQNTAGDFGRIDMNDSNFIFIVWEGGTVRGALIRAKLEVAPGGTGRFEVTDTTVISKANLRPGSDSTFILGRDTTYWNNTYTDELILTNVGAAAADADKLVLSAVDLTGGNTILDINTEGTGVTGTGTPTADRTVAIRVNGEIIYLIGSTIAS